MRGLRREAGHGVVLSLWRLPNPVQPGGGRVFDGPYLGRVVARTVTGKEQVDWFPAQSVAVHVTIVVPRGKKLPEGGTHTRLGAGSALSVAETGKLTAPGP